jgi:hypothetical protein
LRLCTISDEIRSLFVQAAILHKSPREQGEASVKSAPKSAVLHVEFGEEDDFSEEVEVEMSAEE